jgi:YidC/Oxa1 family membrane protein insertase
MDNLRLILFFTLAFLGLMIYQAWQQDYGKPAQAVSQQETEKTMQKQLSTEEAGGVPNPEVTANKTAAENSDAAVSGTASEEAQSGQVVHVETDLLKVDISTKGGTVIRAFLRKYPVSLEEPDKKVELLFSDYPNLFLAQSGLIGSKKENLPTHDGIYQAQKDNYELAPGSDVVDVPLVWKSDNGITVTKHLTLSRDSYLIKVSYEIDNQSGAPLAVRDYGQLQRTEPQKSQSSFGSRAYVGGVYYNPTSKYEKVSFKDMAKKQLSVDSNTGWLAMIQHYFLTAWIPPKDQVEHYYTNALPGGRYLIGSYSPVITIAPGSEQSLSRELFIGPKLQNRLETIAQGLDLTVDFGWLTVIAKPIYWLLENIHGLVGNWGWSIIILTLMIKAAFYKLSETSYKSMANMRKFTPRMQALKDRYGDDKQRLQQAMMELYKKEKINPLGGCLPIVVQIPVFIALYWVLLETVEMRQAPWILWIHSLSEKDPYFILPVIMGVSMFIQQKLNPAPPDPMQAKIMMSLPFVFTVFFAFFPAGLVIYWVVNNLVSILQQWYITRKIEKAAAG